uniref:SEC7 domain-containing protein n=1 Tax=Ditylenchus dipsaci TaxID=166011 RepID=A0A915CNT6_9BILA
MLNQPQHNGHILAGSLDYGPSSGNIISASSSRMFTNYEISDDLTRVHLQHLERKYGGRMRAHNAATKIQRAFRHYRLDQLYRQQVLGHPSARRQTGNLDNSAFPNSALQKSTIERSAHFRQLAKSQPSLKYQPVTSLRAQLQAERHVNSSRPSYQLSSPVSNIHSPRHVHPLKNTGQQRPYMELMSPRLSQRRVVCPNTSATSTFIPHTSSPRQNRTLEDSPLHHGRNNVAEEIQEMVGLKPSDNNNHYFRSSSPLHSAATTRGSSPHQQGFWLPRLSVLNNSVTNSDGVGKHSQQQTAIYHSNSLPRMGAKVVLQGNNMPVTVPARQTNSIQPQHNHQQQPHKQMREWTDQQRRRLYRIALNFFNKKPDRGIQLLIGWGFVDENPRSVAKLFVEEESFFNEIPMYDMEIDRALRQILTYFRLPGEAQKIDHIMQAFSKRYRACNPASACIEEGKLLDKQLLHGIYERVKEFEFRSGTDHVTQVMKVDQSIIGKDKPKLVEPHRRLICYCRLHQIQDANKNRLQLFTNEKSSCSMTLC